jgi:hypothetical protein
MKKLTAFLERESAIRDCSVAPNFLCSAAQTFGKEWETVSVSGFTRKEDHNHESDRKHSQ